MTIPSTVRRALANSQGHFKGRQSNAGDTFEATLTLAGVSLNNAVKAVLLKSDEVTLMAIIRADQTLDPEAINRLFQREFVFCSISDIHTLMPTCDPLALPPLADAYGLQAIMDSSIDGMGAITFASGVPGLLVSGSEEDFARLNESAWKGYEIVLKAPIAWAADTSRERMRRKVQGLSELPAMPGIAGELIRLKNNPYAHASELAAVIEQDPSLSAQLLRYATSPLHGYQGKLESVEQAIVKVLGMDFVEDIALGLALGKAFNNPKEGPLGLKVFWQHAVYCAALTQALCSRIEFSRRPSPGLGYMAGLLHNIGILLLGHLFPSQFDRLNEALRLHPEADPRDLELDILGVSHTDLGRWLMDAWELPREATEAVSEHHNPDHTGDYAVYANLVYIANALLQRNGIGDGERCDIPTEMLQRYGLDEVQLEAALSAVLSDQEGLALMAGKMAA